MKRHNNYLHRIIRRRARFVAPVVLGLTLAAAPIVWAHGANVAEASADATGMKFEVLDVTTSSGSRSKEAAKPAVKIEVIDVTTSSGTGLKAPGDEIIPAVISSPAAAPPPAASVEAEPAPPVTVVQNKKQPANPAPAAAAEARSDETERSEMFAALEQWHKQTLLSYSFDIASLQDPFLPIKEVRGKPEVEADEGMAKRPPILQLELSQLKLVAVTTLSDRPGGSLASFEDGSGVSYILRQGDLIGRNKGRITSIEPSRVIIEEPPRGLAKEPIVTIKTLNVLDTPFGLTRESDHASTE